MRRREFITGLAGLLAARPVSSYAQQRSGIRRIGVFLGLATGPEDPGAGEILRPLRASLQDVGWTEGQNMSFDVRFGGGHLAKMGAAADELVALAPDLIYATGLPPVQALRQRTSTIPIVFSLVADPVGFGLVQSLSRPGGNVTGFVVWDLSIGGKWMQLLQEVAPHLRRIGIMYNPNTAPYAPPLIASARASAKVPVQSVDDFDPAFLIMARERVDGVLVHGASLTGTHTERLAELTLKYRLPTVFMIRDNVEAGGLMSYSPDLLDLTRRAAIYIDKILKGTKPSNLPVEQATKFELVVNNKTAKAIGLTIPESFLLRADEVIE
jgi:putative ABC transport system substrate-binding protein